MGFSYKTLNSNDVTLTSYIANKRWEVVNSNLSQNGVTIFIGENIPLTRTNIFDPNNDYETSNDEYRRLIFESIKHLYYENYTSGSLTNQFFHSSSYFNYEQTTLTSGSMVSAFRTLPTITGSGFLSTLDVYGGAIYDTDALYDSANYDPNQGGKIVVISIDQNIFGSGLSPNSVYISGSDYYLRDDGEGNLYNYNNEANYARYSSAQYIEDIYLEPTNPDQIQLEYVGNIFYSHGLIVITNEDYLCAFGAPPTAVNNYFSYSNMNYPNLLDIIANDFTECGFLNFDTVSFHPIEGYTFPNFTYDNGFINITQDQSSVIPGEYLIGYTINNNSNIPSNTASINLTIISEPLEINNIISSSTCFGDASILPVTFSIDYGVPFYSYSLDEGVTYNEVNYLFDVVVSGSVTASNNNTIYVKDYLGTILTSSFSSWYPAITFTPEIYKYTCSDISTDGKIIITIPSGSDPVSASLDNITYYGLTYETPYIFENLSTGSYTVYAKDSYNCITSSNIDLIPYPILTASVTQSNISCYGGLNGSIIIPVTNVIDTLYVDLQDPTGTYIYTGSLLSSFTNNIITTSSLSTGSYQLYIYSIGLDECQFHTSSFTLTSPTQIEFNVTASYINSASSEIIFNATGGTGTYTYYASNDTTNQLFLSSSSIINLFDLSQSGSFTTYVVDNNGCLSLSKNLEIFGREYIYSGSSCEIT